MCNSNVLRPNIEIQTIEFKFLNHHYKLQATNMGTWEMKIKEL